MPSTKTRALAAAAMVAASLTLTHATPAEASTRVVNDRNEFVNLVNGRALTRFGISLQVSPEGQIVGRAFGRQVTGNWRWQQGYFCRDLFFGGDDLGFNCQMVLVNGSTIRFVADQGQGEYADFRLR